MLKNVSNNFIQNCNSTELTYNEYIVIDNEQIPIRAKLSDDCYENGNFIGSFILKTIQFETSNDTDFKQKEFEYYKVVNGESIKIGTFITTEIQDNDTTELVKVVGMDYGLKTQIEYKSELDYDSGQITLLDVWNEACTLSGLTSGVQHFTNDDFIVDSDQFTGTGATIRDVFVGIAMSSCNFIKVMNDDKIYPVFKETTNEIIEDYTILEDKRDTHPITCVRLGMSAIEGENVDLKDPELIEEYGENWLILNDNPFAYTQAKRSQLIVAIFNKIKGFGYSSFVSKTSFKPYLTCGDLLQFRNKNGDLIDSILLRYTHEYKENDMQIQLEAPSETSATVNYVYPLDAIDISKRTEVIVDKQNQTITLLAEEVGEYDDRISTVEQSVDSIEQAISVFEDLKRNVSGLSIVHLTNAVPDRPLKLSIKNVTLLYPNDELYPSDTLYPMDSYLVIDNSSTLSENAKLYKLPFNILREKDGVYDEFIIETNHAYIIRRIGVNQDGTTYILDEEIIEDLGTFELTFLDGENYVYLESFKNDNVLFNIDYLVHSEFTDTFATELYVNSNITQTANQIMAEVNEKVGEDEIVAKLNIAIEEDQGVINLIGNKVTIESDNFTLDEEGNVDCNNALMNNIRIENGNIELESTPPEGSTIAPSKIQVYNSNNTNKYSSISSYKNRVNDDNYYADMAAGQLALGKKYTGTDTSVFIKADTGIQVSDNGLYTDIKYNSISTPGSVSASSFINTSLESVKKNIKEFKNATDIIKETDVYSYNWKDDKKEDKKHFGLVIGEKYNTPKEFISNDGKGIDLYSTLSICLQAIKEQQEEIEELKKEIKMSKEVK